ncbi:hypothetical protein JW977_03880 [Candidatus Falkowbacteria bacterium]|nr:hypothetical protein [Candidatus Falkowbacteria bacterium]
MFIEIHGLLIRDGKLYIIAKGDDVFLPPQPPRLSIAIERLKKGGEFHPFLDARRAQIVCESANAVMELRHMLWQLLPPEKAAEIIPFPSHQDPAQERKLFLVAG